MNTNTLVPTPRAARVAPAVDRTPLLRDRVQTHVPAPLSRFDQALSAVQEDDLAKWDHRVRRSELLFKDGALEVEESVRLRPTRWALGQMCNRLGIPTTYFANCPTILQDVQANFFLREGPSPLTRRFQGGEESGTISTRNMPPTSPSGQPDDETWLLRSRGDSLRAVLSSSYSPLDNKELLETLAPTLDPRLRVDWFALCDETMHLRIVDPGKTRDALPGDGLSVGVHISNSEVGFRSLCVDALVYRLVCSNGLIALVRGQSLLRRRHVHMAPARFRASLEEAVDAAFATAEGFLEQLQTSTRQSVPDPEHTIEKLGEKWGLSEPVREAAKVALWREKAPIRHSAYGIVNAFTGVAQLLPGDKRYDVEVLAGHLAQSGVPTFALAPREKRIAVTRDVNGEEETRGDEMTALAQNTFDAEIVSRRPSVPTLVGAGEEGR